MTLRTPPEPRKEERKLRRDSRQVTCADGPLATSLTTASEPILVRDLPSASLSPASTTLVARTRRALAGEHHENQGE